MAERIAEAHGNIGQALPVYERTRSVEVLRIQNAARNSTEWFDSTKYRCPYDSFSTSCPARPLYLPGVPTPWSGIQMLRGLSAYASRN